MGNDNNKKNVDIGNIAVASFLIAIFLYIIGFLGMNFLVRNTIFFYLWLVLLVVTNIVFVIGIIGMVVQNKKQKQENRDKLIQNMNQFQLEYDEYTDKLGVIKSDDQATLIEFDEAGSYSSIPHYLWVHNDTLNIFPLSKYYKEWYTSVTHKPDILKLKLKSIPLKSILYFEEIGELRRYTTVSGGGSSLKGALLGYAIAADVGAIIGSREPIKTEIVSEDDRRIELIYKNQANEVVNLEFTHDAYKILKKLIPTKELRRIVNLSVSGNLQNVVVEGVTQTAKEKLKQLNEIKMEGLITDEEFSEQRKKIFDSI